MQTPQIHRALAEAMRVLAVAEHEELPMPSRIEVSTTSETRFRFLDHFDDLNTWAKRLDGKVDVIRGSRIARVTLHAVVSGVRVEATATGLASDLAGVA